MPETTTGADELAALRAEAEALGVKVDGRWGAERLRSEIEAAQPEPGADDDEAPAPPADSIDEPESGGADDEPDEPGPTPTRAGGHIDRGDGRGWVLEE